VKIAPEIDGNYLVIEKSEVLEAQVTVFIQGDVTEFDPGWCGRDFPRIAFSAAILNLVDPIIYTRG
jgi:hypothetical protein